MLRLVGFRLSAAAARTVDRVFRAFLALVGFRVPGMKTWVLGCQVLRLRGGMTSTAIL